MNKLERLQENDWVAHAYPRAFIREATTGPERLRIAMSGGSLEHVLTLLELLGEWITLLYVLHTPRGEPQPGRYQSPELSHGEVVDLLQRFAAYLTTDARHDLWLRGDEGLLVWDRHDVGYFYGELAAAEERLRALGYGEGEVSIPSPHAHHYHAAFDIDQDALLAAYEWIRSELRPADVQFNAP